MSDIHRHAEIYHQLVVIDVGNTNMVVGVYRDDELAAHVRLSTDRARTADEMGALLVPLFAHRRIALETTTDVIVSSVVPPLNPSLARLSRDYFGTAPIFVEPDLPIGLTIRYDHPSEVGADRLVNAVAARARYGAPVIVVDFGTATTFDVIDAAGDYVGGIIAPGAGVAADALAAKASRLSRIDIRKPEQLVGRTTRGAMESGVYYGYIGLVDGILARLRNAMPDLQRVVATGGQASLIAADSVYIDEVDPMLTLEGLRRIHAHLQTVGVHRPAPDASAD